MNRGAPDRVNYLSGYLSYSQGIKTCLSTQLFGVFWGGRFWNVKKSDLPKCVAQCAFTHAFQCENREQLREWDRIPLKEGFSHSPKRGNNSVPLPTKTSQLVITYKWERSELECVWGWAARSYQRGALAPKHKWMERAQCNGETEQRCTVSRAEREETFAWGKGGWILGKRLLMKNWDPFFSKWHGFVPMQMRFLQRWHSTWKKNGNLPGTELTHDLNEKRKGVLFSSELCFAFFYLTSIGCKRTHSEIWIWSMHFCFSSCQTVWQWLCRYPLAPLWTSTT